MKRGYRCYRCDHGHHWDVERGSGEPERAEDTKCVHGHEAVTRRDDIPTDEVQILIRPAARVVDRVKEQRALEGRYWLVLLDRDDGELRRSSQHYTWEEAARLGRLFVGKDNATALKWWKKRGL
jgi:hypothetical protein